MASMWHPNCYKNKQTIKHEKSLGNWLYFLIIFKIRHRTLRTTLHPEKRRPEQLPPHQRPKMAISLATMNLTLWWKRKHRKRKTAPETEMPTRIRTQNSVPHLQLKSRIMETVRKRQTCTYFSQCRILFRDINAPSNQFLVFPNFFPRFFSRFLAVEKENHLIVGPKLRKTLLNLPSSLHKVS